MIGKRFTTIATVILAIGLLASSASAGLLGTGLSFYDGTKTWEGTSHYANAYGLSGDFDWAVFTANNYSSLFPPSQGYTPTPGELVYTYQIHNGPGLEVSLDQLRLLSGAPADHAGYFIVSSALEQVPYSTSITSTNVTWDFRAPNNIPANGDSRGMVFSSPRLPRNDLDYIVDGGTSCTITGVGGPGTVSIPEPSTLLLLAMAGAFAGLIAIRRR
jgi:hypothetical protein